MNADLSQRLVGESYKDYADRMAGCARAAEIDRDRALADVESLRRRNEAQGEQLAALLIATSAPHIAPLAAVGGTCDWGGCAGKTTALRWSPDLTSWLPVCEEHEEML